MICGNAKRLNTTEYNFIVQSTNVLVPNLSKDGKEYIAWWPFVYISSFSDQFIVQFSHLNEAEKRCLTQSFEVIKLEYLFIPVTGPLPRLLHG